MLTTLLEKPFKFLLINSAIVIAFISSASGIDLAIETILTAWFFGIIIIAGGAAYTFVINVFTGTVGKEELWSHWWDRAKTKAVVSSLIVLNILFIFNLIVFIGDDTYSTHPNKTKRQEWTNELINNKTCNIDYKKLKILYHGVNFFEDDNSEWAFRVKITYPKNDDDENHRGFFPDGSTFTAPKDAIISKTINEIRYEIYDEDDFMIDYIVIYDKSIQYKETAQFQMKKEISKQKFSKFKYGKVNIK